MSLPMDSPPPTPAAPKVAVSSTRRRALRGFLALSVSFLLILVVLILVLTSSQPQFAWLTPDQMTQAAKPGPLTLLKYKIIRLAGPLMRYYHPNRLNIIISSSILQFSTASGPPALGAPFITNSDGMSAWILSSSELAVLRRSLKTNSGVFETVAPRIQTSSRMRSVASVQKQVNLAPGVIADVGSVIDATATVHSGSVTLLLFARSTEAVSPPSDSPAVKTNFCAACRVTLPDAGGLIINCGNAGPANPTNYWLIISPVLVDAAGKPIKP
jgi:hypothetical protein